MQPEFQSTLPRRERHDIDLELTICCDFNPRSREGSDLCMICSVCLMYISIHAPAKGATVLYLHGLDNNSISIHAPAKGATSLGLKISVPILISIHAPAKGATDGCMVHKQSSRFQSTLPRRERRITGSPRAELIGISIHAPEKGATVFVNPRPISVVFQSTLPRRERRQLGTRIRD